jgi:hypothetical protein
VDKTFVRDYQIGMAACMFRRNAQTEPGKELDALIRATPADPRRIAAFLDGLADAERVGAIRSIGRGSQRRVWDAVDGFGELDLAYFVPPGAGQLAPVVHAGKNSLPAFTEFEKRFYRLADGGVAGANFQTIAPLTGPGYFVCDVDANRREVRIDYNHVPDVAPTSWPEIRTNEHGLTRFIYGFMIDTMRRVSEHVSIGSAARHGKDISSWFLLCRTGDPVTN